MKYLILAILSISCASSGLEKNPVSTEYTQLDPMVNPVIEPTSDCEEVLMEIDKYLIANEFRPVRGGIFRFGPYTCSIFFNSSRYISKTVCSSSSPLKAHRRNVITACKNKGTPLYFFMKTGTKKKPSKDKEPDT